MKRMIQNVYGKRAFKLAILFLLIAGCLIALGCVRGMSAVGWSGVAIGEDRLYIGSAEGRLVAIKSDGVRAWSEPLRVARPSGGCIGSSEGSTGGGCASSAATAVAIYGTPVVSGELIYLSGYNGKVYAFDAPSLEPRWIYPVEDYLKPIIGGVALYQDKVYFGTSDGTLFALDMAKGIKKWDLKLGGKIWSTPVVDRGTIFIGSFDKKLYAIDAVEGKEKWNFSTDGTITATALVNKDTVYIGSFDRKLYAVNAETGAKKWEFKAEHWFWTTPVVYEDTIYAGSLDGNVYALNAQNGDKIASFETGPVASSPVLAGNLIIVANQKGEIFSINVANRNLKKLADLGVPVSSSLTASNNVVYVHTSNLIVNRIDIATGAKLTPFMLIKE